MLAMEEVFEVSVVDEEDSANTTNAASEAAAAATDTNKALKTLKCKRCGCLQQFEVAAAVENADEGAEKRQVRCQFIWMFVVCISC